VGDQGSEVSNPDAPPSEGLFVAGNQVPDSIEELIEIVAGKLGLKPELICSGNRQRQYSEARSLVAWLAVEEIGHPAAEVARTLGISRVGVLLSLEKAKETRPKYGFELTPPNLTDSIC